MKTLFTHISRFHVAFSASQKKSGQIFVHLEVPNGFLVISHLDKAKSEISANLPSQIAHHVRLLVLDVKTNVHCAHGALDEPIIAPIIATKVLGQLLVRFLIRSDRLLINFIHTACCGHSLARSLTRLRAHGI